MSKATVWLGVSVHDAVVGVILGAIVVSELEDTVAVCPVAVALERRGAVVGEEVERELALRKVKFVDLVESQELIELNWLASANCGESESAGGSTGTYVISSGPLPES